jgi:hypothetical protein
MSALTWKRDGDRLSLIGRIDENADLGALTHEIPIEGVTMDLAGLTRINSIGVREWMDFLSALGPRRLRLERCAPIFVEQLNAIANFAGTAEIVSVMATFECEADGSATDVEVPTSDARAGRWPLSPRCQRCSAEMVPAQDADLYYRFLRYK